MKDSVHPYYRLEGSMKFAFITILLMTTLAVPAFAADVDGKWSGTVPSPGGDIPVTFTFKADGEKLTGSTMNFDGSEVAIKDGKIDGNNISYSVTLDFGGMPLMITYKGVVSGDQLKIVADVLGMPTEFVLKKEAPKK